MVSVKKEATVFSCFLYSSSSLFLSPSPHNRLALFLWLSPLFASSTADVNFFRMASMIPFIQFTNPLNAATSISLRISTLNWMMALVATFFQPSKIPPFFFSESEFV